MMKTVMNIATTQPAGGAALRRRFQVRRTMLAAVALAATTQLNTPAFARVDPSSMSIQEDGGGYIAQLDVVQSVVGGRLQYTAVVQDQVMFRARIAGRCRLGHHLTGAWMQSGPVDFWGDRDRDPIEAGDIEQQYQSLRVNRGQRTFGPRAIDYTLDLDHMTALADFLGFEFDPLAAADDALQAYLDADPLHTEAEFRAATRHVMIDYPIGFRLRCAHNLGYTGLNKWFGTRNTRMPIRLRLVGEQIEPTPTSGGPNDVTLGTQITQAQLLAIPDSDPSSCKLDLSATFVSNGETTILYRLIDQQGLASNLFSIDVDHTWTAFVHHELNLSPPLTAHETVTDELTAVGGSGGAPDDYAAQDTDLVQGYYRLEVIAPHYLETDIAGFSMACDPQAARVVPLRSDP